MTKDDFAWLLQIAKVKAKKPSGPRPDLRRMRKLAPDCSLSASEVETLLSEGGHNGLLFELHRRVVQGRKRLQDALLDVSQPGPLRSKAILTLKDIAATDPYSVNRDTALRILSSKNPEHQNLPAGEFKKHPK